VESVLECELWKYVFNKSSTRLIEMHVEAALAPYHAVESTAIPVCSRKAHWTDKITSDHEVAGYNKHCIEEVVGTWESTSATRDPNDDAVTMDYDKRCIEGMKSIRAQQVTQGIVGGTLIVAKYSTFKGTLLKEVPDITHLSVAITCTKN
jgi:hypothetical protein